jgi:hypothetical protein
MIESREVREARLVERATRAGLFLSRTPPDNSGMAIQEMEKEAFKSLTLGAILKAKFVIEVAVRAQVNKQVTVIDCELINPSKFIKHASWHSNNGGSWDKIELVELNFRFGLDIDNVNMLERWYGWTNGEETRIPIERIISSMNLSRIDEVGRIIGEQNTNIGGKLSQTMLDDIHKSMKSLGINVKDYELILKNKLQNEFTAKSTLEEAVSSILREYNKR